MKETTLFYPGVRRRILQTRRPDMAGMKVEKP